MKSSPHRLLLAAPPHAACLVLVAAHLARATRHGVLAPTAPDLAFVVATHAVLALLFPCLVQFEQEADAQPQPTAGSEARAAAAARRLWVVWALSTALMAMFASRVAPVMPPPLAPLVYGLALLVAAGGFVLLFLCDAGDGHPAAGDGPCAKSRNGDAARLLSSEPITEHGPRSSIIT